MKKIAFTLAEVMITLTIIGIISAIIVPVAINSRPDENVMRFKKAHNTLYQVIQTLVSSDKYYKDGDLGIRASGETLDGTNDGDFIYFCTSFIDLLSIKSTNCNKLSGPYDHAAVFTKTLPNKWDNETNFVVTEEMVNSVKSLLDAECLSDVGRQLGEQIKLTDGIVYYETSNMKPFGFKWESKRVFAADNSAYVYDINGFGVGYKVICIDIDGEGADSENKLGNTEPVNFLETNSKCDDKKDICPFGYGIRADGKILTGARADEWLAKDIQGEN